MRLLSTLKKLTQKNSDSSQHIYVMNNCEK